MKLGHPKPSFPLVLVEWEDSARPDAEWRHLADVSFSEVVECQSVGFLLSKGEQTTALAPNIAEIGSEHAQASGIIRIPTRCITKIRRLRC
jgi:hypothetical protein